jgi:hypothetical protein
MSRSGGPPVCTRCGKAYLPHHLDGMGECENCIPADEVAFANDLDKLDLGRLLDDPQFLAKNIVNQLFDLAEVPVEKRQDINDEADAFVYGLLLRRGEEP